MVPARQVIILFAYFFAVHALIVGWARYSAPIVPVAVILSWLYDLTAEGLRRTPSATGSGGTSLPRKRLAALLVGKDGSGLRVTAQRPGESADPSRSPAASSSSRGDQRARLVGLPV
jgi:hypothetical protein